MNLVTNLNIKTMSSKEIASLTNKTHSHVLRDIRAMLVELDDPNMDSEQYQVIMNDNNQTSEILLDKELTETLITGYSVVIRRSVIRRWNELEEQVANPVVALPNFTDPAAAAIAWAEQYKAKEAAEQQLAIAHSQAVVAAPKIAYYEQVLEQNNLMTISDVARKNGITAQELNKILVEGGVYDQRSGKKTFRSDFISKGYGKMITTKTGHTQAKLTIKGEVWVTTVAMNSKAASNILGSKQPKKVAVDQQRMDARQVHTAQTIQMVDKLLIA